MLLHRCTQFIGPGVALHALRTGRRVADGIHHIRPLGAHVTAHVHLQVGDVVFPPVDALRLGGTGLGGIPLEDTALRVQQLPAQVGVVPLVLLLQIRLHLLLIAAQRPQLLLGVDEVQQVADLLQVLVFQVANGVASRCRGLAPDHIEIHHLVAAHHGRNGKGHHRQQERPRFQHRVFPCSHTIFSIL